MENTDKYTIKLPGRSVLVFLVVASGVFVVYYFASRVNNRQTDANRKSDLVWLQKILDEKKHKPIHHRLGKPVNLKHHFYDADDYDYDDYFDDDDFPDNSKPVDGDDNLPQYSDWDIPQRKKIIATPKKFQPIRNSGKAWGHLKNLLKPDIEQRKSSPWNTKTDDSQAKVLSEENDKHIQADYDGKSYTQESSGADYVDSQAQPETLTDAMSSELASTSTHTSSSDTAKKSSETAKIWPSKMKPSQTDFHGVEKGYSADDENQSGTKTTAVPHRNWPLSKYVNYRTLYASMSDENHLKGIESSISTKADLRKQQTKLPLVGNIAPIMNTFLDRFKGKSRLSIDKFLKKDAATEDEAAPQNKQQLLTKEQKYGFTKPESKEQSDLLKDDTIVKDNIAELKKHIHYPEYMDVFDWNSTSNLKTKPACVPLQTVSSFVRICIHSAKDDPDVSAALKSRASWEHHGSLTVCVT